MNFEELLSKDTSYLLAMKLDSKSLLNLFQASKRFYEWFGKDEIFWKQKIKKDYPFLLEYKERESWKFFYLEMSYYITKIEKKYDIPYISTKSYNPKVFFNESIEYSYKLIFNKAMYYAAQGGHMNIVKLLIEKGASDRWFSNAMINAAEGGHMDIVKLMVEKGATWFNSSMEMAAREGHMDIVKYLQSFEK